ncbi:MAG: bifunctional folylpolyglutamate synthase/dihydrofolate synthase [Planctomycetia bacterium]|nr:bifunctional folylpolyglutamate synthase/dihydrofolate synthase [Planctomycetia bacterium]
MSEPVQTYEQAVQFLFDRVNFERTPAGGKQDFKLERMRRLLELLGSPQTQLPCIHIAGTKGKGSTAIMLAEMLSAAGYRTGLYTSPHVEAFEERMQVAGVSPNAGQMIELVRQVQPAVRQCETDPQPFNPTFFEITTALAWLFFLQQKSDIVVLEVGLGGRLDSTNVCSPIACVLTTISRDHTQILGSSLSQIAREKAGIIKPGVPVISGVVGDEAQAEIAETCRAQNSDLWQIDREFSYVYRAAGNGPHDSVDVTTPVNSWSELPLMLSGKHQAHNAAVAMATIDRLRKVDESLRACEESPCSTESSQALRDSNSNHGVIRLLREDFADAAIRGMSNVRWPMRIEVMSRNPTVIVDAAHNWESAKALGRTLDESFPNRTATGERSRRVLIFAATKDKDVSGILRQLAPCFDSIILTKYLNNPRAVLPDHLRHLMQTSGDFPCHIVETPADAWQLAQRIATPRDLICVTGSFFIAAEIRELILTN